MKKMLVTCDVSDDYYAACISAIHFLLEAHNHHNYDSGRLDDGREDR